MAKVRLPVLLLILASAALTVAAGMMLFSSFMLYDDEGYVLFSIRNFVEHGALYRDVYSQYGPLSYVLYYFLHGLGMPLTHTAGRLVTLVAWSSAASFSAWAVWRITRHSACALVTLAAVFVYLWVMISEPNHPGGLITAIVAVLGTVGYHLLANGRWRAWSILVGAGSAALVLAKINVGAFATLSAGAILLLHARSPTVRRFAPWVVGSVLAVLPFALMRPLLQVSWVATFAALFALAAIPVAESLGRGVAPANEENAAVGAREWTWAILAGLAVAIVVLAVIFSRGTSPADLIEGTLLGPLRHPSHFSLVFPWPRGTVPLATLSFAGFLALGGALRLGALSRLSADRVIAWLRLGAAAALGLAIWQFPGISPDNLVFAGSISCLWLFLWPLTGETSAVVRARAWLGLLFLGQWLHPFPVPGSQIAWGTFLAIPLAVIGAWQAAGWLVEQPSRLFTPGRRVMLDLAMTVVLAVVAVVTGNRLAQIGARYLESRPLNLPGAEAVRLPDSTTALYRVLVFNADAHSDVLFSLPGMFSLNLWADLPAPTLANVTHWFSLLSVDQQQAIITQLAAHPRAAVIVQAPHLDFLRQRQLNPSGPLYDYVMSEFEPAFTLDGFEFRVHRGRHVAPLFTAELFLERESAPSTPGAPNTLAKFPMLLAADQEIARIEFVTMDDPHAPPLVVDSAKARIELVPIDMAGTGRGALETRTLPFAAKGATMVSVYFDRGSRVLIPSRTLIVLRNRAGAELALIRIRP